MRSKTGLRLLLIALAGLSGALLAVVWLGGMPRGRMGLIPLGAALAAAGLGDLTWRYLRARQARTGLLALSGLLLAAVALLLPLAVLPFLVNAYASGGGATLLPALGTALPVGLYLGARYWPVLLLFLAGLLCAGLALWHGLRREAQ